MTGMIAVWFSCGAASAIAAKETIERWGSTHEVRVVNTPIAEEHPDNRRFCRDVSAWLGVQIEILTASKYPASSCVEVWDRRKFMSAPHGAPCTEELKKRARYEWEDKNSPEWHVLGFTADEYQRADRFRRTERSNLLAPLIDAGITKQGCFERLIQAGVNPPLAYKLGYPNANCIGCVKATSPTYWNHVRRVSPAVFAERAEQSRRLGARLVRYKGERIFLDELPEDAVGRPMKGMDFECGIFCEERFG